MSIWKNIMKNMVNKKLSSMSNDEKVELILEMMPQMMESIKQEDMMEMIHSILPKILETYFREGDTTDKIELIHKIISMIMEDTLSGMTEKERKVMLGFCHNMLNEMEKKFKLSEYNIKK